MSDLDSRAVRVAALLVARGQTVAVAESSAGGLIAAALLRVPGASAYFLGGAVVYTSRARAALVNISRDEMEGLRSSSEPYARLLARKTRELLRADWGLAETGAAGPTGNSYGDAAGHTCLAVSGLSEAVRTLETGADDRAANMLAFATAALDLLEEVLSDSAPP